MSIDPERLAELQRAYWKAIIAKNAADEAMSHLDGLINDAKRALGMTPDEELPIWAKP